MLQGMTVSRAPFVLFALFALLASIAPVVAEEPGGTLAETLSEYGEYLDPPPLLPSQEPGVAPIAQPLGDLVATLTTSPERLSPSEGTLLIRVTRGDVPVAGERFTLRLEGRGRVLAETVVVTDAEGVVSLATYFNSPGTYTLVLATSNGDNISFPVAVRGTRVLVIGFLVASGILLALLFEKKLH